MKRLLFTVCLLILLPIVTSAYTLVLKDGRRIEVQSQYRIVSDLAVFTLPEGNRFSISMSKINVEATELANGEEAGSFVKNVTNPPKVSDKKPDNSANDDQVVSNSRPTNHKLTNSDFDRYRIRREEANREAANRAAAKAAAQLGAQSTAPPPEIKPNPTPEPVDSEAALLASRRELEKKREEYWRSRARALLTQMRVEEEQLAMLQAQVEDMRRTPQPPPSTVSVYGQPPQYPSQYPGVVIGGVPIGIGRPGYPNGYPYPNSGNSGVVVINNQNPNQQGMTLQERLVSLQLQHQETLVRYDEMCEEARRDGALPGWLR